MTETPRLVQNTDTGEPLDSQTPHIRVGEKRPVLGDAYHLLLTLRWPWFLSLSVLAVLALNALFALAYVIIGGVEGARPGSFADAFYFSVQTLLTIGYGKMHPESNAANLLASLEGIVGMIGFALAGALMFARLSRPRAQVLFSRVAVVAPHNEQPALMFRCANRRTNQILEASLLVTLVRAETTVEGVPMRRFHALKLVQPQTPIFNVPWTLIHPIDAESPLRAETVASLARSDLEIVVLLSGIDDTYAQAVHARHSYVGSDIRWNVRFADIVTQMRRGQLRIDFRRFHDVVEINASVTRR